MSTRVAEIHVRQLSEIAIGLPEGKLKRLIAFARQVQEEVEKPRPLRTEEILSLASKRAAELRHQPRPVVEAKYQDLLRTLETDVITKGIKVEEYPCGD